jgi:citrate lyase subunit beta/citryl-CoA lyase
MDPLRRSLLFVPGAEPRRLEKARSSGADTLLFDLEDSVAPTEKDRARDLVGAALREGGFGMTEPAVRINPPGTAHFDADLEMAVLAGARAVMIPKSESAEGLAQVAAQLDALEAKRAQGEDAPLRILALVESAAGLARISSLGTATSRVAALAFGHADFSRDMGLAHTDASSGVILHARCALAIAAKAARVPPIDTVFLDVRDEATFRADTALGIDLGFEGKLCIHPHQVALANLIYTPTEQQIAYARRLVEAWECAQAEGLGVFTLDGKMIDSPLVAIQERVLGRARRAGLLQEPGTEETRGGG